MEQKTYTFAFIIVIFFLLIAAAAAGEKKTEKLSEQDLVVASTILAEARGEGRGGMYAVAAVISQRALNRKLSPQKVCLQNALVKGKKIHQFSCWNNIPRNNYYSYLFDDKNADYAINLAYFVNRGHEQKISYIDRERYKYADHYFNWKECNPSWQKNAFVKYKIGNHLFLRLKEKPVKIK